MRVSGSSRSAASAAPRAGVIAPGDFRIAAGSLAAPNAATAPVQVSTTATLEALLALQETPDPAEGRRRGVRRAGRILDALDELKLAVVEGGAGAGALQRLSAAVGEARPVANDERLDRVLEQIELRAAVELAKREVAGSTAAAGAMTNGRTPPSLVAFR